MKKNTCISLSWKGVDTLSVPPCHYSHGCRRNNNVIQVRLVMACWLSVNHCSVASRVWRVEIRIGWTLNGEGLLSCTSKAVIPDES